MFSYNSRRGARSTHDSEIDDERVTVRASDTVARSDDGARTCSVAEEVPRSGGCRMFSFAPCLPSLPIELDDAAWRRALPTMPVPGLWSVTEDGSFDTCQTHRPSGETSPPCTVNDASAERSPDTKR
jgi:hypothetical protein